ncbi:DUF58 domain-containing protein [Methylobacter tundripaludum]|uniref:Uncharacterized protein n=1 Tax=Methylobacter tundripaludum (strain ATCC BAA-1195 / DSM 17260 / SV96) TaxID=697282 RepID=G3IXS1_METTV|nr:DUF58 domain-containing protein [Methylobacter tundripaludum]EGW23480.1 protein of unknown function DUF58 [Methylobacter tundripaludum SV96]
MNLKERFSLSRFVSGEKAVDAPVTLNHRRIFILPTQRGLGFVLLITVLLLIAFVYNNNLAYMLAFLLASIFFITILHSYKALAGLVVQKGRSKAVFAGEAAGFDIHINNPTDRERQVQIKLQDAQNLAMEPHSTEHVTLYSITQKRGWHPAGSVTLSSTYPLGLFRAWSPIRFDLKALVYPKPAHLEIPFPKTSSAQAQQGFSRKGADDFYGLQEYQSGDSIKHIHWKAFAKGLGVFSKQYGGEQSLEEIRLDYEHVPGHNIEERLSQLCRWVVDAEQAGIRYGFALPGLTLPPDHGLTHYRKCLEALALF